MLIPYSSAYSSSSPYFPLLPPLYVTYHNLVQNRSGHRPFKTHPLTPRQPLPIHHLQPTLHPHQPILPIIRLTSRHAVVICAILGVEGDWVFSPAHEAEGEIVGGAEGGDVYVDHLLRCLDSFFCVAVVLGRKCRG